MQDADAESSVRLVSALVSQLHHYNDMGRKARLLVKSEMERINWHHACPEWSASRGQTLLALPFEGDWALLIILSKAFLMAGDHKIKDETIVRQIKQKST